MELRTYDSVRRRGLHRHRKDFPRKMSAGPRRRSLQETTTPLRVSRKTASSHFAGRLPIASLPAPPLGIDSELAAARRPPVCTSPEQNPPCNKNADETCATLLQRRCARFAAKRGEKTAGTI